MSSYKTIQMGPELMKLLRDNRMTRMQIASFLEWDIASVKRWTTEYGACGVLLASRCQRVMPARRGPVPIEYTLAPAWRGQA